MLSSNVIQQARECWKEPVQYVATEIMAARRRQTGAWVTNVVELMLKREEVMIFQPKKSD